MLVIQVEFLDILLCEIYFCLTNSIENVTCYTIYGNM